ncbi:MAG: tetratricopeptide repeat protein, partial [Nitrospinaceae bacterium]
MTIKKIVLSCLSIFIFFFLINSIWAQENNALTDISNANELYHDKDYIAAAKIFKNLIAEGHVNGYLYFNLGNTHMRLGEIGPAILNYLLAKSLLPRNESIEANLKYAINKTVDRLDPPRTGFIQELFFWVQAASLNEY